MDKVSSPPEDAPLQVQSTEDEENCPPLPGLLGQLQRNRQEFTLGDWILQRQAQERRPFQPHWDEIMRRVAAGDFPTLTALGAAYGKRPDWAARLRDVAIGQRVLSAADWKACFSGQRKRRNRPTEPLTAQPSQQGGTPPLSRSQFEAVFLEKQDALTFDLAVQLIRLGCWSSAREFARHFRKPERWAQTFRRLLMREQIMTAKEWRACWRQRRRRGSRVPYNKAAGTTSFKP
jgi:hypothetical protein